MAEASKREMMMNHIWKKRFGGFTLRSYSWETVPVFDPIVGKTTTGMKSVRQQATRTRHLVPSKAN